MFVQHQKVLCYYAFTTANVHVSKMAPLLQDIEEKLSLFVIFSVNQICDIPKWRKINLRNRVITFCNYNLWETVDERAWEN